MTQPIGSESFPYFGDEHAMLRATIRRFIADACCPRGDAWEEQGCVPRRDPDARWARSGCSACATPPNTAARASIRCANAVLAEELGRSTYGGFAVTVLVHTDMASPHLYHAGSTPSSSSAGCRTSPPAARSPPIAMTEADAGSDLTSMRTHCARKTAGGYRAQRREDVHHQRRARRSRCSSPPRPASQDARPPASRCFAVEKGTPGFRVARRAQEARLAVAATRPSWCSRTASCRTRTCWARRAEASTRLVKNLQNERIVLAAQALGEAMKAHRAHARLGQAAPGLRRRRCGTSRRSASACRCGCAQVERPRALLVQHRLARYAQRERRQGGIDAQGAGRHAGQRGDVRLPAVPRRHGLHARDRRSSA